MSTPYDRAVSANMAHLQTTLADWSAVPVLGMTQDDDGREMPTFDFSAVSGYATAPTLYPSQPGSEACGLCGHQIKRLYWIAAHSRRWTLSVGSECIGRFQEQTGAAMAKEAKHAAHLAAFLELDRAADLLRREFRRWHSNGYGGGNEAWNPLAAFGLWQRANKLRGRLDKDSSPAALTRWARAKGEDSAALLAEVRAFLAEPHAMERRAATRRAEIVRLGEDLDRGAEVHVCGRLRQEIPLTEYARARKAERIAALREEARRIMLGEAI